MAIARALAQQPTIILADEPTGNLDTTTGNEIMSIFDMLYEAGQTIIIVTHEQDIASKCKRVIMLRDGKVSADGVPADVLTSGYGAAATAGAAS